MRQVLCATLKFGDAIGCVNMNASICRYRAAFISAPPKRVGTQSQRERRRNLTSWRMLDPSSSDAGGRRGKITLFSKHLKVTFSFQAAIFRGALESLSSDSHWGSSGFVCPFSFESFRCCPVPIQFSVSGDRVHYVVDRRERKCLGLFES